MSSSPQDRRWVEEMSALSARLEAAAPPSVSALAAARPDLERFRGGVDEPGPWAEALDRLILMVEVGECLAPEGEPPVREVAQFLAEALGRLAQAFDDPNDREDVASWVRSTSQANWGQYVELLDPAAATEATARNDDPFADDAYDYSSASSEPEDDEAALSALLRRFGGGSGPEPVSLTPEPEPEPDVVVPATPPRVEFEPAPVSPEPKPIEAEARDDGFERSGSTGAPQVVDAEFREDFLAEAAELFERIESDSNALVSGSPASEGLRSLRRTLHTFKGAAGSVGLADLAAFVHALEDRLELAQGPVTPAIQDLISQSLTYLDEALTGVRRDGTPPQASEALWALVEGRDAVSQQPAPVSAPRPTPTPQASAPSAPAQAATAAPPPAASADSDGLIRVSSERIDDLMDLVSELITRHGQWSAQGEEMRTLSASARVCRNKLMADLDRLRDLAWEPLALLGPARSVGPYVRTPTAAASQRSTIDGVIRRVSEQVEDVAVLAETTRAAALPLADDGDAVSRLTHQLWDALQAIRVVPIRGLFQRLVRVARDAARVEGRQVEVLLVGEDTELDRSVQDKAYEPLLHVVRNSVGHGIESPEDRGRAGKSPVGRITLEASRAGNTLVLRVSDDGKGLDYAAIETKARRIGLIGADEKATLERLNGVIFLPGFSTKQAANAISGRGVGMDVVASEVGKLNGTITLESRPGNGTTLTIRLPARYALEQAMVVRIDGQPFALPILSLEHVETFDQDDLGESSFGGTPLVKVRDRRLPLLVARQALGLMATPPPADPKLLLVRGELDSEPVAVMVDSIEGPRELVVKPLPSLLAGHRGLAGTGLAVTGELVFMLDPSGLVRRQRAAGMKAVGRLVRTAEDEASEMSTTVLVVDDSISVRRVATRHLKNMGFQVEEVSDGFEALRKLRGRRYRMVLSDLEMPRMDGFELLSELQRSGALEWTPVIVASTRGDAETRRRVLQLGARAFLPKPINPEDLARIIEPLLGTPTSGIVSTAGGVA